MKRFPITQSIDVPVDEYYVYERFAESLSDFLKFAIKRENENLLSDIHSQNAKKEKLEENEELVEAALVESVETKSDKKFDIVQLASNMTLSRSAEVLLQSLEVWLD